MNLHRSSAKADWEKIASVERNGFQKIAAATGGVISPANILTIIGLGVVMFGLLLLVRGDVWAALVLLVVGRLLDIADGLVAEATGTKSPVGELFDAVADKIGTLLTIFALVVAQIASWWVVAALLIPQVGIMLIILLKKQKNIRVHPTLPGKLSMALVWGSIAGLLIAKGLDGLPLLLTATHLLVVVSFVLGVYAAWQYVAGRDQD